MKILYYDCFAGISGDMNLAAMIDLGVPEEYLRSQLSLLQLSGYTLTITREKRSDITGTRIDVIIDNQHEETGDHDEHRHNHNHTHTQHDHIHNEKKEDNHQKKHTHHHRNLSTIKKIITDSSLGPAVKNLSISIFTKIAEAEAKVHERAIDEIHFHEVGAVDSLVDIVGAAICLDYLNPDKVLCSTLELGSGFVTCQHGILPVPAPATVEIVKNIPTKRGGVPFEATTPTGAALMAAMVDTYTDKTPFTIQKCGYGVGHTQSEIPNLLRVFLGEQTAEASTESMQKDTALMIECNIDDMNPEFFDYIMSKLFACGADDVFLTPIIMKKSRPGTILSVLCARIREQAVLDILFTETSTLGIRKYTVEKSMLSREFAKIKTRYGEITVKTGVYNGKRVKSKPEYEECRRLAELNAVSLQEIYAEVMRKME